MSKLVTAAKEAAGFGKKKDKGKDDESLKASVEDVTIEPKVEDPSAATTKSDEKSSLSSSAKSAKKPVVKEEEKANKLLLSLVSLFSESLSGSNPKSVFNTLITWDPDADFKLHLAFCMLTAFHVRSKAKDLIPPRLLSRPGVGIKDQHGAIQLNMSFTRIVGMILLSISSRDIAKEVFKKFQNPIFGEVSEPKDDSKASHKIAYKKQEEWKSSGTLLSLAELQNTEEFAVLQEYADDILDST